MFHVKIGRWYFHWYDIGSWRAQSNSEGHYNFRGRRYHVSRIKIA